MSVIWNAIWTWLFAGSPQHYWYLLVAAAVFLDWLLPYLKRPAANSFVHLVQNALLFILYKNPLMAALLAALGLKRNGNGVPPAVVMLLLLPCLTMTGCTAAQSAKWRASGRAIASCLEPAIGEAVQGALVDLSDVIQGRGDQIDIACQAQNLAIKYGVSAVWCAAQKLWAIWIAKESPKANAIAPILSARVTRVRFLVDNPEVIDPAKGSCPR